MEEVKVTRRKKKKKLGAFDKINTECCSNENYTFDKDLFSETAIQSGDLTGSKPSPRQKNSYMLKINTGLSILPKVLLEIPQLYMFTRLLHWIIKAAKHILMQHNSAI